MSHDHCNSTENEQECCHCHCHHEKESFSDELLQMADDAWMEILGEKIKERISAKGDRLDKLADLIVEANAERWKSKMNSHKHGEEFKSKIADFFCKCCK